MAGSVFDMPIPYLDPNTKGILQLVEDDDYLKENIVKKVHCRRTRL